MKKLQNDDILKVIVSMVAPFVVLFGIYVILNGHISPGGGFSGGTIIGAALILFALAFGIEDVRKYFNFKTLVYINVVALLCIGFINGYAFIMGSMGIPNGIPLGVPGAILSAGIILPLDIAVGVKVACTMYELFALFSEGEV